jgi:membrane protein involved in colicin uptake
MATAASGSAAPPKPSGDDLNDLFGGMSVSSAPAPKPAAAKPAAASNDLDDLFGLGTSKPTAKPAAKPANSDDPFAGLF